MTHDHYRLRRRASRTAAMFGAAENRESTRAHFALDLGDMNCGEVRRDSGN
jgi:hypothetical protein